MTTEMTREKPTLLIIEDDEDLRTQMKWGLAKDYQVLEAMDKKSALQAMAEGAPQVATLDLGLPPDPDGVSEGFGTLSAILDADPLSKIIIITGRDERENALKTLELGAYDFLAKPVDLDDLRIILQRAFYISNLERDYRELKRRTVTEPFEGMLGTSPQISAVHEKIRKVAPTEVPVMIIGESGTGKELTARAVHSLSDRKNGPFIPINCGAIPENLLESELFGHEKGSFTGAHVQKKGRIELARGGTLFLDEIGELPHALQVKILRYLQDQVIERVGGREKISVDARIVAATNMDLEKAMGEGRFREDLYYRLSVVTVKIPPLREREGDILMLARSFLHRFSSDITGKPMSFTASAEKALDSYDWPGNIREMENRVKRAVIMADGRKIKPTDLELAVSGTREHRGKTLKEARQNLEMEIITNAVKAKKGNLSQVARELGISRPALYDLLRKLEIKSKKPEN